MFAVKKTSEHFCYASVKCLLSLIQISNGEICKEFEYIERFCYMVAKWPTRKVVLVTAVIISVWNCLFHNPSYNWEFIFKCFHFDRLTNIS